MESRARVVEPVAESPPSQPRGREHRAIESGRLPPREVCLLVARPARLGPLPDRRRVAADPAPDRPPALDFNAAFAPDGDRIAFVSERDGNAELYTIEADGSGLRRLTDDFALDDRPAWSPDGRRIAFSSTRQPRTTRPGLERVYVMEADGGEPPAAHAGRRRPTTRRPGRPQGDLIAVASGSGEAGKTDLFVMDARRHRPAPGRRRRRLAGLRGRRPGRSSSTASARATGASGGSGSMARGWSGSRPPDVDAFTPSASADGKRLVVAVAPGRAPADRR